MLLREQIDSQCIVETDRVAIITEPEVCKDSKLQKLISHTNDNSRRVVFVGGQLQLVVPAPELFLSYCQPLEPVVQNMQLARWRNEKVSIGKTKEAVRTKEAEFFKTYFLKHNSWLDNLQYIAVSATGQKKLRLYSFSTSCNFYLITVKRIQIDPSSLKGITPIHVD